MTDVANVSLCKACIPAWWMCLSMICQWNARGIPSKTLPFGGGACDATFGRVAYIDARHNLQHMGALERPAVLLMPSGKAASPICITIRRLNVFVDHSVLRHKFLGG